MIPFGFSAGDFAAGLVLLHKVIAALREIDGASSQFSFTIMELEVLQTILRKIQCLQRSEIATEHLDTLCFLGHQCHLPLAAFLERMKDMKPELDVYTDGKGAVHMRMKRSFRKAQWGIQLKNHVVELKAAIAPQLTTIGILLQLIDLYVDDIPMDGSCYYANHSQRATSENCAIAVSIHADSRRLAFED